MKGEESPAYGSCSSTSPCTSYYTIVTPANTCSNSDTTCNVVYIYAHVQPLPKSNSVAEPPNRFTSASPLPSSCEYFLNNLVCFSNREADKLACQFISLQFFPTLVPVLEKEGELKQVDFFFSNDRYVHSVLILNILVLTSWCLYSQSKIILVFSSLC